MASMTKGHQHEQQHELCKRRDRRRALFRSFFTSSTASGRDSMQQPTPAATSIIGGSTASVGIVFWTLQCWGLAKADDNYYRYHNQYYNDGDVYSNNSSSSSSSYGNDDYSPKESSTAEGGSSQSSSSTSNGSSRSRRKKNTRSDTDDLFNVYGDEHYRMEQLQYQNADDTTFHWDTSNTGFSGVSVMPLSCLNYNGGHVIKYQLFESSKSYQCHFAEIATFVVSISHYMRAYFNYQALTQGSNFQLPADARYIDCAEIPETASLEAPLYAKVGCMERETFTSTKLQLHLYTDEHCSQFFDDGQSAHFHATTGYDIAGKIFMSKVSFRPPFYSCLSCAPQRFADTFNKKQWYDDDYWSQYLSKYDDYQGYVGHDDYAATSAYQSGDDKYKSHYQGQYGYDDYHATNDDNGRNRRTSRLYQEISLSSSASDFEEQFWNEFEDIQRSLYSNKYDVGKWNMCQRIYKYGLWCDDECRSLDFFHTDMWSSADIILLAILVTLTAAMMLLVVAKRLSAQQKARVYGRDHPMPGLPPFAMTIIFCLVIVVIVTMAKLKFINETLVFAVVTCILLFIYTLKLTLFKRKQPLVLAAPRHDMFDNPLEDSLWGY